MNKKILLVLGLTALPGGGKDFIGDILSDEYGFYKISPGDIVREITHKEGYKDLTREIQTKIQKKYKKLYGEDYVMQLVYKKALKAHKKFIVISGIRTPGDYWFFKKRFGDAFLNIFIEAPRTIRFKRTIKRGREDAPSSYAEFVKEDKEEIKAFDLKKTIKLSEIRISNDDGETKVKRQVKNLIKTRLKTYFSSK